MILLSTKLNVPYAEKDIVKKLGARWDPINKTWYVPDNVDLKKFSKWIDDLKPNLILDNLFIAVSQERCWKCQKVVPVLSLCSKNFTYIENPGKVDSYTQEFKNDLTFFSSINLPSQKIAQYINNKFPFYYPDYSKTIQSKYWMNHCIFCKAKLGDFFLYNEPGGAFFPIDPDDAKKIELIHISHVEKIEINGEFHQSEAYVFISSSSSEITYEKFRQKWNLS